MYTTVRKASLRPAPLLTCAHTAKPSEPVQNAIICAGIYLIVLHAR